MTLRLFEAVDGLQFWWRSESLVLQSGRYDNHVGALFVTAESGEPWAKVTVNMSAVPGAPPLAFDEFCVKWDGHEGVSGGAAVYQAIYGLHLFNDTGCRIASGYSECYAAIYRFDRCVKDASLYAVECSHCRAAIQKMYEKKVERALARDAVARLESLDDRGFSAQGTRSGRLSSAHPNAQNVQKRRSR